MTKIVPITVLLTGGDHDDVSPIDARRPGIQSSQNLDFSTKGIVAGRPGFDAHNLFSLRTLATTTPPSVNTTTNVEFDSLTFNTFGMCKYRDASGERPAVVCLGRVWTWEQDGFADRLYCGSTSVDRLAEFFNYGTTVANGATALQETVVAYNFAQGDVTGVHLGCPLLGQTPSIEYYDDPTPFTSQTLYGGSASVTTGGHTYHCLVGNKGGGSTNLFMTVRRDYDQGLLSYQLQTDCLPVTTNTGEAPSCAAAVGQGVLWVVYAQNGGGNYVLLRVDPTNGTTLTKVVTALAGAYIGVWVYTQNNPLQTLVAITRNGVKGVACRQHNSTTLALNGAASVTFDGGAATNPVGPVVIGGSNGGISFVQYTRFTATANSRDVMVGAYDPTVPTVRQLPSYFGWSNGASSESIVDWGIPFGPVVVNGRSVLGLSCSTFGVGTFGVLLHNEYTWFAIDITDTNTTNETAVLGTRGPGILAMGPVQGTAFPFCPASSTSLDLVSFRFASLDFKEFSSGGGSQPSLGINQVSLLVPITDSMGEETVFSGSVPHGISRGYCYELPFVMSAPECFAQGVAGGPTTVGSYSIQCCWRWVDEAGVTHRSAPSNTTAVVNIAAGATDIQVTAQNYQLTQREYGDVVLEVYSTGPNPTPTALKFLRVVTVQAAGAVTTVQFNDTTITNLSPVLYTAGGAVLGNFPVSADGGVAVVNNRMWLSDGKKLFASKQYKADGIAPAWNDEGALVLFPPEPAGRVLGLRAMDDKLLIFCERGIYWTHGDGPDDTGQGPGFLVPVQVSGMGLISNVSLVSTENGVVFQATNTGPRGFGGLYLIDRGLGVTRISGPEQSQFFSNTPLTLSYVTEREWLVASTVTAGVLLVFDMRAKEWTHWTPPNGFEADSQTPGMPVSTVGSNGALWGLFTPGSGLPGTVGAFTNSQNYNDGPVAVVDIDNKAYTMSLTTNDVYVNGQDGLGWGRVRSVTPLGEGIRGGAVQNVSVVRDQGAVDTVWGPSSVAPPSGQLWPVNRDATEYRLPIQKCSQISVTVSSIPATARWSAIRLDTLPSRAKAPAAVRQ